MNCGCVHCTIGLPTCYGLKFGRSAMKLPTFESELAYAIEGFEESYDRKPTQEELEAIRREVSWTISVMSDSYVEWCAVRGRLPEVPLADGGSDASLGS